MSTCWLCPGQGSQSPQMFQRLLDDPLFETHLRRFAAAWDAEAMTIAADEGRCFANRHAQPLIVLYGLSVAAALDAAGMTPSLVAGYSVGELTAHAVSAALAPDTALALAVQRALCMDAAAPADAGMLAVRGLRLDTLAALATGAGACIAIRNGADHAVLAGPRGALDRMADDLNARGGLHVVPLPITVPAHSAWLEDAVAPFRAALQAAAWRPHQAAVLSGLDGQPVSTSAAAIDTLARQIAMPLDWAQTLDMAIEMGATSFFELGPGTGLTRMVRERHPAVPARALDEFSTLDGALAWLRRCPS